MIIRRGQPLANNHPEGSASCKWSSQGVGLLQMITLRDQPLANDHPEEPSSCKWSSVTHITLVTCALHSVQGSRFNLADLSRTICSCFIGSKEIFVKPGEEIMFRTSMLDDPSVLDEYSTVNNIIEKMTIIWNSYHDTFSKTCSELESGMPHIDPWQRSFEEWWDMSRKTSFVIFVYGTLGRHLLHNMVKH